MRCITLLYIVLTIFSVIVTLYGAYFVGIALIGLFKKPKTNPYAEPTKRIAALIPARDEARVIGQLVDSLMKQRYPEALYDVYVIINNCTDATAEIAERAGAKILLCDRPVRSKGEVLRFAFDALRADGMPAYDGYCVFDADNLVDGGFMQAANNALCAGFHIAQAYRDSKNPGDNWITGCTSVFFWFMSRLYNDSRAKLGLSASLNGTGILMSDALLSDVGYDTDTLTEDQEYTAQCVLKGYKIGCMNDAVIYDEQPLSFKDSFIQRRRWGAGSMQCSRKYLLPLLKKAVRERDRDACDVALLFFGMYIQVASCMPALLTMAACVRMIANDPVGGLHYALFIAVFSLFVSLVSGAAFAGILTYTEKKWGRLTGSTYLLMCVYLLTWAPANLLSLFTRPPQWRKIDHVSALSISQCEVDNVLPGEVLPKRNRLSQTKGRGA